MLTSVSTGEPLQERFCIFGKVMVYALVPGAGCPAKNQRHAGAFRGRLMVYSRQGYSVNHSSSKTGFCKPTRQANCSMRRTANPTI